MLIPGVPAPGVQQERLKTDRQLRPGAIDGVPGDPLSGLPTDDRDGHGGHEHQHRAAEQSADLQTAHEPPAATEPTEVGAPDLPRKGLLVDIRA
ncbi:hypothetical protein BN1049_02592 [Pseudomonas saudimassiliensis]|uniref:Uncharacterized protein n=1 Tax=Pseudomonas saudimassiliensis TaxID=1461581 RepID=A0A078MIZ5_9PSED|nr:hypothetical protein [Pseudomonas saudimassiliensis]CEA06214.1 hypothetical protein BN1049_02592 [Pseudomonas saudimassiliensis]CEF27639.1 hypothetical protein BN1049_02592 [Pseudomonas saudimassiliensis]